MKALRTAAALLSSAAFLVPLAAGAQGAPGPAAPRPPAHRSAVNGEETISGRISKIESKYRLEMRDDRGYIDRIQLHQGTIINPTGLQLEPGMVVTILGYNLGNVFGANEIDATISYNAERVPTN